MKDAIIYIRVSTQEQADSRLGIDSQHERCEAFAKLNGFNVRNTYIDDGVSASIPLLERRSGKSFLVGSAHTIIALCQDRLFRSVADMLATVERLADHDVDIITVDEGIINLEDDDKWMMAMIRCIFAELERRNASKRTKRALEQVVARGGKIGEAPYGWRNVGDGQHDLNIEEQYVISKMLQIASTNVSLREIARLLNSIGMRTRDDKEWSHVQVGRILQRGPGECVCGMKVYECCLLRSRAVDGRCCQDCSHA